MIIEFSNAQEPKNHSTMAVAIVVTACAFFFVPTTLIILGYYSSKPTGTLISPLPQGVLSNAQPTPAPTAAVPDNQPIIATDNTATTAAKAEVVANPESNIIDKVATIEANATKIIITDPEVSETSQIFLTPRPNDKAVYSIASKKAGEFTINTGTISDTVRYVDYHIVNP